MTINYYHKLEKCVHYLNCYQINAQISSRIIIFINVSVTEV